MATTSIGNKCGKCEKNNAILKCGGCLQDFCYNDFANHRQELHKQLDDVEVNRDLIRQTLNEQITESQREYPLIQQINQWEEDSIQKIKQTANEVRTLLFTYTKENTSKIELKLNNLTDQLRQSREDNAFVETNLNEWNKQLIQLKEELNTSENIQIKYDTIPFVTKIFVDRSLKLPIHNNQTWMQNGITVAGGNGYGNQLNQLFLPWSVHIDDDQTIYVADYGNHRIVEWKNGATNGQIVVEGYGDTNQKDQIIDPSYVIFDKENDSFIICDRQNERVIRWSRRNDRKHETIISNVDCWSLAIDNDGYLYTGDIYKHEIRRWKIGEDTNGILVAGGNKRGNSLDQLDGPYYIYVDDEHSVYVSDRDNHRVVKWIRGAHEGIIVAGGHGKGSSLSQLSLPCGIIVDQFGTIYVVDCGNNRIMRWLKGATEGTVVVGGNGLGRKVNQLNAPCDLSFDRENNLYIVDFQNHRIQKFNSHVSIS